MDIYFYDKNGKCDFRSNAVPINFIYDVYQNPSKEYRNYGCLKLSTIKLDREIDWKTSKFVFSHGDGIKELDLSGFDRILVTNLDYGFTTIELWFNDIFDLYYKFIENLKPEDIYNYHMAFDTQDICNLKCPYCSKFLNLRNMSYNTDFYLAKKYISNLLTKISEFNPKMSANYHRFMGGEPFINDNVFNYMKQFKDVIDFNFEKFGVTKFQTYTNLSNKNTVDKILKIYNEYKNIYCEFEIWGTIDSIDVSKSLRIRDQKTMDIFIENIKELSKHYNYLDLNFNVMYIDDETFIDTIKFLKSLGYRKFEIAFDCDRFDPQYDNLRHTKRLELQKLDILKDCKLTKSGHYDLMPVFFNLRMMNRTAFNLSTTMILDENKVNGYKGQRRCCHD